MEISHLTVKTAIVRFRRFDLKLVIHAHFRKGLGEWAYFLRMTVIHHPNPEEDPSCAGTPRLSHKA